ncbi:MAG: hypothetical protein JXX14_20540 [Deltaproteobacteria bacterium]|nr:hypothetical protein [Deltaproteobacteria bacterium]
MKRKQIATFFSALLYLCIAFVNISCGDECHYGDSKCENNKIYQCDGPIHGNWVEFRDCDNFNATCVNGITTEYNDYSGGYKYEANWNLTHSSCVNYNFDCQGIAGERCIDTNKYVVNCVEHKGEIVAAAAVDNWDDRPYCVIVYETAVFTQLEETYCEPDAMQCDEQGRTLLCVEGTWQWASDYCHVDEQ